MAPENVLPQSYKELKTQIFHRQIHQIRFRFSVTGDKCSAGRVVEASHEREITITRILFVTEIKF